MTFRSMHDAWRNRPPRERWLIGVPVAALLVTIVYLAAVEPLSRSIAQLERAMPGVEARHVRLRAQAADVRAHPVATSAAVARSGNASAIVNVAQAAIDRHRLRPTQPTVERADDARVRVAFARVAFDSVWPMFQELQSQSGVRVVALRVDRIDASHARIEATLASGESR